jgi:hypothetical protein
MSVTAKISRLLKHLGGLFVQPKGRSHLSSSQDNLHRSIDEPGWRHSDEPADCRARVTIGNCVDQPFGGAGFELLFAQDQPGGRGHRRQTVLVARSGIESNQELGMSATGPHVSDRNGHRRVESGQEVADGGADERLSTIPVGRTPTKAPYGLSGS